MGSRKGSENVQSEGFKEILDRGKEYYEIRLESIGGLGANLCGKMLGELGIKYLDVNSSNFSSYGSEKTGTPVKGFIRFCKKEKEIRLHSPIVEPDVLVIFHQALMRDSSVWKGCSTNTKILIALEPGKKNIGENEIQTALVENKGSQDIKLQIYGIEAQKIALETKSRINVVMLGAVLKIMGIDSLEAGENICKDTLGKKYPASIQSNLEGMRRGYEELRELDVEKQTNVKNRENTNTDLEQWEEKNKPSADINSDEDAKKLIQSKKQDIEKKKDSSTLGYLNAPIGGINPRIGSTVVADLSPSRQGYIPLFIKERCINCGLCFSACPDMVFQFKKGKFKGKDMMINCGLDYYHCKGCLRCVDVCPVNALVRGEEDKHKRKEDFLPNQELLRLPKYYEKAGADGYITSESYLTERRMEGGEV